MTFAGSFFDDSALRGWIAPPRLATAELRRQARALWLASWPFLAVVAAVLAIAVFVEPDTLWRRATTVAAVGSLVLGLHFLSRRGKPALASWMLVIGLTVIVTQRAWITGGIHAPVAGFYLLFILMAGALLGAQGALVTATVSLLGAIVLTAGEAFAWLSPRPGAGSPLAAMVFVIPTIGLALVAQLLWSAQSRSVRLRPDAVQMLVHDMRSPIQRLIGNLDILREDARGDAIDRVDGAMDGAQSLNRMTSNLLDLSRLDAGRMPVKLVPTNVAELARNVVATFRHLHADRTLAVVERGQPKCACDRELTRRVLDNLVSNAIKHTPPGAGVLVEVSGESGRVRIAVRDQGPGISLAQRDRLFELFGAEAVLTESGFASSGLGLAFCRLAAEAQGGSIHFEEAKPTGSIFVVDIPC